MAAPLTTTARKTLLFFPAIALILHASLAGADTIGRFDRTLATLFEERECDINVGDAKRKCAYRLFVPKEVAEPQRGRKCFPLIVALHGNGERGSDNYLQLKWLHYLFIDYPDRSKFPAYILAYQHAKNVPWIEDTPGGDSLHIVEAIVEHLLATEPIDPKRVSVFGISSGGSACWEFVRRRPDLLAAAAPMGSGSRELGMEFTAAVPFPIWAFHARDDVRTPVQNSRDTVARLSSMGQQIALTEVPSIPQEFNHDCWPWAFMDYDLTNWLIDQRQGVVGEPPGVCSWRFQLRWLFQMSWLTSRLDYSELAPRCIIPAILGLVIWMEIRRRRKHSATNRVRVETNSETT